MNAFNQRNVRYLVLEVLRKATFDFRFSSDDDILEMKS